MFKWFKFGVVSVTGIFVIVGVIIGIALTVLFNLYIDRQQKEISPPISEEKTQPAKSDDDRQFDEKEESFFEKEVLKKENYEKLQRGIDYNEAVNILGGNGTLESETKSRGHHSLSYKFEEKDWEGIQISLRFVNDELDSKRYYHSTTKKSEAIITADIFDLVKTGMTYDEVKKITGGDGTLRSDSGFANEEYHRQTYQFDGASRHSSADFTFEEGKLTAKSQYGL